MIRRGLKMHVQMTWLYRDSSQLGTIYVKIQGAATKREFMPKANCQI